MKTFKIEICRISYAFRTVYITDDTEEQACERALDTAGDYDYSEATSEYEIDNVEEQENETTL